jgi:hypothetical protein
VIDAELKLPSDMKEEAEARAKALGFSLQDYLLFLLFKEALNA